VIDFDLKHAHPEYRDLIVQTYEGLLKQYPGTPLKRVRVYEAKATSNCSHSVNRSLGDATDPTMIRLNGFWFSRPPSVLREAGEVDDHVPGYPGLRWHGGLPQPFQVLTHEGMHVVLNGLDDEARAFAHQMWLEATINPSIAFSGYAIFGGETKGSEWWAENGSAHEAGNPTGNKQVEELGHFLAHAR
jgi:hypothetical protein